MRARPATAAPSEVAATPARNMPQLPRTPRSEAPLFEDDCEAEASHSAAAATRPATTATPELVQANVAPRRRSGLAAAPQTLDGFISCCWRCVVPAPRRGIVCRLRSGGGAAAGLSAPQSSSRAAGGAHATAWACCAAAQTAQARMRAPRADGGGGAVTEAVGPALHARGSSPEEVVAAATALYSAGAVDSHDAPAPRALHRRSRKAAPRLRALCPGSAQTSDLGPRWREAAAACGCRLARCCMRSTLNRAAARRRRRRALRPGRTCQVARRGSNCEGARRSAAAPIAAQARSSVWRYRRGAVRRGAATGVERRPVSVSKSTRALAGGRVCAAPPPRWCKASSECDVSAAHPFKKTASISTRLQLRAARRVRRRSECVREACTRRGGIGHGAQRRCACARALHVVFQPAHPTKGLFGQQSRRAQTTAGSWRECR